LSREGLAEARKKMLLTYASLLFAAIAGIICLLVFYVVEGNPSYLSLALMVGFGGAYAAMRLTRVMKLKIPRFRLVKVVKCEKCGYVEVSEPGKGDYVFKEVGDCTRCGGRMVITSIYREKLSR